MTIRERYEKEQFLEAVLLEAASHTAKTLGTAATAAAYEVCFCSALHKKNILYAVNTGSTRHILLENLVACELVVTDKLAPLQEETLLRFLRRNKINFGYLINFSSPDMEDEIIKVVNQRQVTAG